MHACADLCPYQGNSFATHCYDGSAFAWDGIPLVATLHHAQACPMHGSQQLIHHAGSHAHSIACTQGIK